MTTKAPGFIYLSEASSNALVGRKRRKTAQKIQILSGRVAVAIVVVRRMKAKK